MYSIFILFVRLGYILWQGISQQYVFVKKNKKNLNACLGVCITYMQYMDVL